METALQMNPPSWYDGKHINEVGFCSEFLSCRKLKFIDNTFYSVDGAIPIQRIEKDITELLIGAMVTRGIGNKVTTLLNALKKISYNEDLQFMSDEIHALNGILKINGTFSEDKVFCKSRLNVKYNTAAATPLIWLKFLSRV